MNSALLAMTFLNPIFSHFPNALVTSVTSVNSVVSAPAVGDSATYTINASGFSGSLVETISAIDTSTGQATVMQTATVQGQSSTDSSQVALNALTTLESSVTYCSVFNQNGQTAKVEEITVPAGTFKVCHLTSTDGEYFLGAVPVLGIVKGITKGSDGTATVMTLTSYIKK